MRPPEGPGDSGSPGPQPPRRTRFLGAAAAPCRPRSTPGGPRSDSPRPPASQPPPGAGSEARREETSSAAPKASSRPGPTPPAASASRGGRSGRERRRVRGSAAPGRLRSPHTAPRPLRTPLAPSTPPGSAAHRRLKASTRSGSPTDTCRPNGRRAPAAHVRNRSSQPQPSAQPGRNPRRPRLPANPRPARPRAPPPSTLGPAPESGPSPRPLPLRHWLRRPSIIRTGAPLQPLVLPPLMSAAHQIGGGSVFVTRPGPVGSCFIACINVFVPAFSQHGKDELSFGKRDNALACTWCTCVQETKRKVGEA